MSGDVVLVGDIMLDRYIHGYANNLNSRAPVPVLKETERYEDVGAATSLEIGKHRTGCHSFRRNWYDQAGGNILEHWKQKLITTASP